MRFVIMLVVIICVVAGFFFVFVYEPRQGDTVELAARQVSKQRQKEVFAAILRYKEEHTELPRTLDALVRSGHVSEIAVTTPCTAHYPERRQYAYFPENYGDPNAVVLSETREVDKLGKTKLLGVEIVTFANGETKIRTRD